MLSKLDSFGKTWSTGESKFGFEGTDYEQKYLQYQRRCFGIECRGRLHTGTACRSRGRPGSGRRGRMSFSSGRSRTCVRRLRLSGQRWICHSGRLALILSDGMGKGIRAGALSRAATSRLRKNLKGGMAPAHAIKEVNTFMVSHAKAENFATLDLLIIDRNTRKAKFYKMGAASSFVLRDGKVKMFEQAALPIGIIPEIRLTHVALQLRPGDIVLMASDGITEAGREAARAILENEAGREVDAAAADRDIDGTWLRELLEERAPAELAGISARKLARWILAETVKQYGERERDDLTVAAIKILPA